MSKKKNPLDALFEAIELGMVDDVVALLESGLITTFNVVNKDDLLPVDVSVMLGRHSITKLLLGMGAHDSNKFYQNPKLRLTHIKSMIVEANRDIFKLQVETTSSSSVEKAEFRAHLCKVMLENYERADVPDPPTNVLLHVTSNSSLMVTFREPENINYAIATRYKIEWCRSPEFKFEVNKFVMTDLRKMEYVMLNLKRGELYYVRVSAYNMKGFGQSQPSTPPSASPSSWHDLDQSQPWYLDCTNNIYRAQYQFEQFMQEAAMALLQPSVSSSSSSASDRSKHVKRLTHTLSSSVKFRKSLKAGVYLASLFYSDKSRLLVTTDDYIPTVKVGVHTGTSIGQDFVWLANLACTWENIQTMIDMTEVCTTSPTIQFKNMLLHAVLNLQNAMKVMDLGLLHPIPYQDSQGAILFVVSQYTRDSKAIASTNSFLKWTGLHRLQKRHGIPFGQVDLDTLPVPEQVVTDAQEIMTYHQTVTNPMGKGLYLGYLKCSASVSSMKVFCPIKHPNTLPHLKIRNNPNLSTDEWQWLKSLPSPPCPHPLHSFCPQSLQQILLPSLKCFLKKLGFKNEEATQHRLYINEVVELSKDVTILLVLPPLDQVCTISGGIDHFVNRSDFVALPISTFEIVQLYTHQHSFMTKFSMMRVWVEVELLTTVHLLREALSDSEMKKAKEKKEKVEDFYKHIDQVWHQMRWIDEAIQTGRDSLATSDKLLTVATVILSIEKHREAEEQRRMREDALLHNKTRFSAVEIAVTSSNRKKRGVLQVMLSYKAGLIKGCYVKLSVDFTTTAAEVIKRVVTKVAATKLTEVETDHSDYYLVACLGGKEKVLEPTYAPLRLQSDAVEMSFKVVLEIRKHSEDP